MPPDLRIEALSDQSVFVRAAISGVIREAVIAGALTGLLILLFLGSWRSTLIITISIPLSILASICCLSALGETINIMTLGGLALAVGILVDDATVTIENINYHLEQGKDVEAAILDGAHQIALPALVSTLSICIVFVPMFLLAGIAKFLFIPLAEAVVFAMLASYLLSRTLVPTLAKFWLKKHDAKRKQPGFLGALSIAIRARLRTLPRTLSRAARLGASQRPALCRHFPGRDDCHRDPGVPDRAAARAWARTSSPPSTAAKSSCIFARAPGHASKRPLHSRSRRGNDPRGHSSQANQQHRR